MDFPDCEDIKTLCNSLANQGGKSGGKQLIAVAGGWAGGLTPDTTTAWTPSPSPGMAEEVDSCVNLCPAECGEAVPRANCLRLATPRQGATLGS